MQDPQLGGKLSCLGGVVGMGCKRATAPPNGIPILYCSCPGVNGDLVLPEQVKNGLRFLAQRLLIRV